MRQFEREITDHVRLEALLRRGRICRLGLAAEPAPYVVPLNYGYADGCLYFHCAPEGKKLDLIREHDRVGFEVEAEAEIVPSERACGWETKFQSVIGHGRAVILTAAGDKRRGLDVLMRQHADPGKTWAYAAGPLAKMVIIQVLIEHMTGKQSKHHVPNPS